MIINLVIFMVDIHSHILPGFDDGADTMIEALAMARLAVSGGTKAMVVTPHCNIPYMYDNFSGERLKESFNGFKKALAASDISLRVYLGAEVFVTDGVTELLRKGRLNTLNGGRYMLVEFSFDETPEYMDEMLGRIMAEGVIPVVAHPERYYATFDYPEIIYNWIRMGCRIQVNKGSLLGRFGREVEVVSRVLLGHRLVHCIASDAHASWRRTPYLADVKEYVTDLYNSEYADVLLKYNPHRIIMDKDIRVYDAPRFPEINIRNLI